MAGIVGINPAEVAGMLLVYQRLENKIVNMILFLGIVPPQEGERIPDGKRPRAWLFGRN